jgi:hypothetical protein
VYAVNQIILPDLMLAPKGEAKGLPKDDAEELKDVVKKLRDRLGFKPELSEVRGFLTFRTVDGERQEHYRFPRAFYTLFEWCEPGNAKAMNERGEWRMKAGLRHIINFAWR